MSGFISNKKFVAETSKTEDLLDFSREIENLEKISEEMNEPTVIGLIGKFGSGKSTMLFQLRNNLKGFWLDFDAWKYPDRKNLWEGFVLDIAEELGDKESIRKKIDGASKKPAKELITTIAKGIHLVPLLKVVAPVIERTIGDATNYFLSESPITRVYQLQNLLTSLFNQVGKDIYIVIEDIDRSQDAGVFFLETLKQFLGNLETKKRVIVYVPIGTKNFVKYRDEYSKCIDYLEDFYPNNGLKHFIETVVKDMNLDTPHDVAISQVSSFFEQLMRENTEQITMREIKRILRQANERYIKMEKKSLKPDWRVVLAVESMRIVFNDQGVPFYRDYRNRKRIDGSKAWGKLFELILLKNPDWNTPMAKGYHSWELNDQLKDSPLSKLGGWFPEEKTTYNISTDYFQES